MARIIDSEECVACGSCIGECPVEAIKEGDVYTIDSEACIDCGACEAACPNDAISEDYYYTGNTQTNSTSENSEESDSEDSFEKAQFTKSEEKYLDHLQELVNDGANLTPRELKLLELLRESLGITVERDQELKDFLFTSKMTVKEQQYLDSVRGFLVDGYELTSRERKILVSIREAFGISEERARFIENMISNKSDKEFGGSDKAFCPKER
jgi:ferredoxin